MKGGWAWADTDQNIKQPSFTAHGSDTRDGWLFGAGVEYAFMPNWSAKVEYNYLDFGKDTVHVVNLSSGNTYALDFRQTLSTVQFGLNYRFMTR